MMTTIVTIGDSMMAAKPLVPANPEKGWAQILPLYLRPTVRTANAAANGASTRSFMTTGLWAAALKTLEPGDLVLIGFGHNDQKREATERYAASWSEFSKRLHTMVTASLERGAYPFLLTPIVRRRFDADDRLIETHGDYPDAVRAVSQQAKCPLIDLHAMTRQWMGRYGAQESKAFYLHVAKQSHFGLDSPLTDDTHLSALGAHMICDIVVGELLKYPEHRALIQM